MIDLGSVSSLGNAIHEYSGRIGPLVVMAETVWITGAGGLIGNYLVQAAPNFAPGTTVAGLTRAQLNLTDFSAVRSAFKVRAWRLRASWTGASASRSSRRGASPGSRAQPQTG